MVVKTRRTIDVTKHARLGMTVCGIVAVCLAALCPVRADEPADRRRTHVVEVFEAHRDAVVNINTTTIVRQRFGMLDDDPFFRQFFGGPFQRDVKRTSLGSGFVVHRAGYIITNAHVVDGADEIEVILADGQRLLAEVLASDAEHELAVVKVDPPQGRPLSVVTLGASDDLMVGEPVVAIGNPLGYQHTVTAGIISAVNRSLPVTRRWQLEGLIQTDTPINPGNSGGPLLNAYGQVIGINTAIRGDAQNIGFAMPVGRLRSLMGELLSCEVLNQTDVGGRAEETVRLTPPADVQVTLRWVPADSSKPPMELAAINGQPVTNIVEACVELLKVRAGQKLIVSDGRKQLEVAVKGAPVSNGQRLAQAMVGLTVRPLTAADRRRLGLRRGSGLLIESVEPGGPASRAGLEAGDVMVQIGRYRVDDLDDLAAVLGRADPGALADVYVIRGHLMGRARLRLRSAAGATL